MELTQEQLEKASKNFLYRKQYYSEYHKIHREKINQRQLKYLKKVYEDPDKLKHMKERQKKILSRSGQTKKRSPQRIKT